MRVGLVGLGRMGEGMSRRMMKAGIEVWGYRRDYEKEKHNPRGRANSNVARGYRGLLRRDR